MATTSNRPPEIDWDQTAERELKRLLKVARSTAQLTQEPGLKKAKTWEAGFRWASPAEIARLKGRYLGRRQVTDVLSFPSADPFRSEGYLGDIVVCQRVMEAQARELGHSDREELRVLLVHALLHLLGYDHERSRKAAAEMARVEARLLKKLGQHGKGLIRRSSTQRAGRSRK